MNINRTELFRRKLQQTLEAMEEKTDEFSRGVKAVVTALKHDYDVLFPETAYQGTNSQLESLIEEHCHKEKNVCPLCGEPNIKRKGIKGYFYGCTKYPICKGSRSLNGRITINEALREFIAEKLYEEEVEKEKVHQNRFANLDI